MRKFAFLGVLAAFVTMVGCSSTRTVQVPPRMDLREYGTVGLIDFTTGASHSDLARQTNEHFLSEIQSAQPGVPVLELGPEYLVLTKAGSNALDPATIRAIGEQHQVDVLLFGVLEAKEVRPRISIGNLESLNAKAEIEGKLTAKMFDAHTGATIWTCAMADKRTLATVSVTGDGVSGGGSSDASGARSELFESLVVRATRDFRPSWRRVRVQD